MMGSIAGDIIGSVYESRPIKTADFEPLFGLRCGPTDDTFLTVATASALLSDRDYASAYRNYGRKYPKAGYGASFQRWVLEESAPAYKSWGNGSAMRVSPIGWACSSRDQVLDEAAKSAIVTHDHPEGIKGAQATALAVFLARTGSSKDEIKEDIEMTFGYDLTRRLDDIRPEYRFDVSCQGSVPESIIAFLESRSTEDAIRLAISLGGDSDTQACIAGGIAEAYYGPLGAELSEEVSRRLPDDEIQILNAFVNRFMEA
uniref:ADP-ribosylglycohydrolase n=1 Tax=Trieres chinensis TaxID=1514140 RepID=A0A7S2E8H1_TRICV